jgi:hypothetical protein
MLVSHPASLPFIASETVSAKMGAARRALGLGSAGRADRGDQIRLLLGLPQARLSVVAPNIANA